MRSFDSLTKYGRARRLRGVAMDALRHYDLDVARIRLVNNESNCTFRVDCAGGSIYALRINLPGMRSGAEIRAELVWQEALWQDTDIAVPRPIRTRDGDLVVEARGEGIPETRLCNLSSWVYGRTLSHSRTPGNFRKLGVLSARIHEHGRRFIPPEGFAVPKLDRVIPKGRPDVLFDGGQIDGLPRESVDLMREMNEALETDLQRLFHPAATAQLIHGDLHWWNVLLYRGTLQPIDFEDCVFAFPIQEIAITFYYVLWDGRFADFLSAYREGYESVAGWPEDFPGQFELLMGQRALDLVNLLMTSPYANDRELIPEFVDIIDTTYREHFQRWRSLAG